MQVTELKKRMTVVLGDRQVSRERRRTVYEFGDLIDALVDLSESAETPPKTAAKARQTLAFLLEKAREHDDAFFVEAFVLNFVGEAMARESYISQPLTHFLKVGLYFYGLNHIDRFHAREAMDYMVAHAETLDEFTSRESLKAIVAEGKERLAGERNFCVVHLYLNAVRKRFWKLRRGSEDAELVAASLDSNGSDERQDGLHPTETLTPDKRVQSAEEAPQESRIAMMLRIFATELEERQQRIYLARHPLTGRIPDQGSDPVIPDSLEALLSETREDGKATWQELAQRFSCTEKTVKREYLRSLTTLLRCASEEVFGERTPSSFVRRMIRTLTSIAQERDLRIRDNAGRGLSKIVERWEIALRYVLNHAHARAAAVAVSTSQVEDGDSDGSAAEMA